MCLTHGYHLKYDPRGGNREADGGCEPEPLLDLPAQQDRVETAPAGPNRKPAHSINLSAKSVCHLFRHPFQIYAIPLLARHFCYSAAWRHCVIFCNSVFHMAFPSFRNLPAISVFPLPDSISVTCTSFFASILSFRHSDHCPLFTVIPPPPQPIFHHYTGGIFVLISPPGRYF